MNCHESTYAGFAFSEPTRRRTIPRPTKNIPVLRLRPIPGTNTGATTAIAEVSQPTAPSLDGYAYAGCWLMVGYFLYGGDWFLYWLAASFVAFLFTPMRYWLVSGAFIFIIFKFLLLS